MNPSLAFALSVIWTGPQDGFTGTARPGDRVVGRLTSETREATHLVAATPGATITLRLESYDFDAELSVEERDGSRTWRSGAGGAYSDARLEVPEAPAEMLVRVRAEDACSGEYVLTIRAGPMEPKLSRDEWLRASSEHCERAAGRAFDRREVERGLRLLSSSWQYAHAVGDVEREWELVDSFARRATSSGLPLELIRARVQRAMTARRSGDTGSAEQLLRDAGVELDGWLAATEDAGARRTGARLAKTGASELGDMAAAREDWSAASTQYQRALDFANELDDARDRCRLRSQLVACLDAAGDAKRAEPDSVTAVEEASELDDPATLARALWVRGRVLSSLGRAKDAAEALTRSAALDAAPDLRVAALGALAEVQVDLARYESALCSLERVEELVAEHRLVQHEPPAALLRARIAIGMGELPRARAMLESALERARSEGRRNDEARILGNLGLLRAQADEAAAGRALLEESFELSEVLGDRKQALRVSLDLAQLADSERDFDTALEHAVRAGQLAEALHDERYRATSRGAQAHVLARRGDVQAARELAMSAAHELERLEEWEAAADAHETLARIALALRDLDAVRRAIDSSEKLLAHREDRWLDGLERATIRSRSWSWGGIAHELVRCELDAAGGDREIRARILRDAVSRSSRYKGVAILEGVVTRGELAPASSGFPSALAGEAWIDYVDGLDRLYAYVVTPSGIEFCDLGERAPIESAAHALVDAMTRGTVRSDAYASAASDGFQKLLAPVLEKVPPGTARLVVSPTPGLSTMPFDALVDPVDVAAWDRRGYSTLRCVIDDYEVVQAPSLAFVAAVEARPAKERSERVLMVGDPIYFQEARSDGKEVAALRVGEGLVDFGRIKDTRDEVFTIAELLLERSAEANDAQRLELLTRRRERSLSLSTRNMDLYLGSRASLDSFRARLGEYTHLHFAVHGYVDPQDPRRSGLVLTHDPHGGGLWAVGDILRAPIDADLVVLSACETASGPIVRGEGVLSIAHAFQVSGARAVIATSWRVDDRDSATLMKEFYARTLENGAAPSAALRSAKLALREPASRGKPAATGAWIDPPSAHPHVWAPYLFVGGPSR